MNAANPGPGAVGESGSGPGGSAHPQSANPSRRSMGPMAMGGGGGGGVKDGCWDPVLDRPLAGLGAAKAARWVVAAGPAASLGLGRLEAHRLAAGLAPKDGCPGRWEVVSAAWAGVWVPAGTTPSIRQQVSTYPRNDHQRGVLTGDRAHPRGFCPWRPVRTSSGGNFEGVLGFGSTPQSHGQSRDHAAPPQQQSQQQHPDASQAGQPAGQASWEQVGAPENADKKPEINFGNGGGPGWGSGQKKWRIATGASGPGDEKVRARSSCLS